MIKNITDNKETTDKLRTKILEYISRNNLASYICEHLYYTHEFRSETHEGVSNAVDWLNTYKLKYVKKYYFDHTLVFKRDEEFVYDEYDYLGLEKGPIEFGERYNIPEPLLSMHFENLDNAALVCIAKKLGLTNKDIESILNDICLEAETAEKLERINTKISEITMLRDNLQGLKNSLRYIAATLGEPDDEETIDLQRLSVKIEEHIKKLESEIETERTTTLTLK